MKEIINELNKAIMEGKSREDAESKITENIKEATRIPELYKIGLNFVNEILDKSDIIDNDSILNIINFGYKEYGANASLLLPHIKCENLNNLDKMDKIDKVKDFLNSMEFIPIIREINLIFHEMITKVNECDEREEKEGFDVDWENEYDMIKAKYEFMEKKTSITKQILVRIKNENGNEDEEKERNYSVEEIDKVEEIVKAKDLNKAINAFSSDPDLFYEYFIHICAQNGWKEGVELALDICYIADDFINHNLNGKTPLMHAIEKGQLDLIKYLIEKGVNIEAKSEYGKTPLMYASEKGQLDLIKYLVEKGVNIEAKDDYGYTALMYASEKGQLEVVKYLVEKGANINAKKLYGSTTALMYASEEGQLEVVKYLIEKGAKIEAKDNYDKTALIYACEKGHLEVVKYLIEKGANIEKKCVFVKTSLIYASEKGHLEVVKYLVEKGANIKSKCRSGRTALMYAIEKGHSDVANYLKSIPK